MFVIVFLGSKQNSYKTVRPVQLHCLFRECNTNSNFEANLPPCVPQRDSKRQTDLLAFRRNASLSEKGYFCQKLE